MLSTVNLWGGSVGCKNRNPRFQHVCCDSHHDTMVTIRWNTKMITSDFQQSEFLSMKIGKLKNLINTYSIENWIIINVLCSTVFVLKPTWRSNCHCCMDDNQLLFPFPPCPLTNNQYFSLDQLQCNLSFTPTEQCNRLLLKERKYELDQLLYVCDVGCFSRLCTRPTDGRWWW